MFVLFHDGLHQAKLNNQCVWVFYWYA